MTSNEASGPAPEQKPTENDRPPAASDPARKPAAPTSESSVNVAPPPPVAGTDTVVNTSPAADTAAPAPTPANLPTSAAAPPAAATAGPSAGPTAGPSAPVDGAAVDAKPMRKGNNKRKNKPYNNRKKTHPQGPRRPGAGASQPRPDAGRSHGTPTGNGIRAPEVATIDATAGVEAARLPFYSEDADAPPGLPSNVLDAVVKIYATHCDPNYSLPWQMRRQTQSTSSGFVISGRRILTNAHSVEHFTVVKVKKRGSDHKFIAKVLAIGNECDIALMTINDEDFWTDLKPLKFGPLPELQASVIVMGFPIGGENISVTAGVVSRVEIQEYTHGASQLLGIQIDAAINSGSSGGPALNHKNEVVGIAFQSLNTGDSDNIGYLVAESVVDHFLKDFARNGRYTGFCYCGFQWQRMENISLRRSMKMKDDENGILVRRVDKTSEAPKVLNEGDIITHIDDTPVSNAGTVPYRSGERISFHYIITTKFTGDKVRLSIIRDGEKKDIEYALGEITKSHLVPVHDQRRQPEYLTVAGLVFVAISEPYLSAEYGEKWDLKAPVKLLEKWMHGYKETSDEQVVVLSQVLNAEINIGYEYVTNTTVHRFNGQKVCNLGHLAQMVEQCEDEYLRFDLDHDEVVVVSRKEALECSADILETHCIPAAYSIGPLTSSANQKPHHGKKKWNNKKKFNKGANAGDGSHPRANGAPKHNNQKRNKKPFNKKNAADKKDGPPEAGSSAGAPPAAKAAGPAATGSTNPTPSSNNVAAPAPVVAKQ